MKTMSKSIFLLLLIAFFIQTAFSKSESTKPDQVKTRTFEFNYELTVPAVKKGEGPVVVYVPIAQSDEHQKISDVKVDSPLKGEFKTEKKYGNKFWKLKVDDTDDKPVNLSFKYNVERKLFKQGELNNIKGKNLTKDELKNNKLFLKANKRVPVNGELIEKVRKNIPKTKDNTPLSRSKAIYDYTVDTMEYKKVGTGWGNGDTFWACSEKYGNCTDFHALFISLARSENIPSRFEIGFPIPLDKKEGKLKGYHCWVTFLLPEVSWTPIDASEAKKNLELKEMFFGTHPADRVKFTIGRDLELDEDQKSGPLNYFVYPHVEIGGKALKKVDTKFSYKETKRS